jgi:hypothetical protein
MRLFPVISLALNLGTELSQNYLGAKCVLKSNKPEKMFFLKLILSRYEELRRELTMKTN